MAKQRENFVTDMFSISVIEQSKHNGVTHISLQAKDRFSGRRHSVERKGFMLFTSALEAYLKRNPHLDFDHPKNFIRRIVYMPPAIRSWAAYMPGGFATLSVHNPDRKHLKNGKKLDYLTRNLFRHSYDSIGLRSRAYAMSWFIYRHFSHHKKIHWLSIACGTGQPTFDAARLFTAEKQFYLADMNEEALHFAVDLSKEYGIPEDNIHLTSLNVTDEQKVEQLIQSAKPHIVEAMGLFEYLDNNTATELLHNLRKHMPSDGVLVFTNMHTEHPQLHLHKRGLGWPGVIQRTTDEVIDIITSAGFKKHDITVLRPDDNVYAVYGITKSAS